LTWSRYRVEGCTGTCARHLQQMVGIVHEFLDTVGIKLSDTKSYYTTNDPAEYQPIYIEGSMTLPTAGMNGDWKPNVAGPTLTHKLQHEAIRYLGVHFALDGSWEEQKRILTDKLQACFIEPRGAGVVFRHPRAAGF
jgi:hypothetical protein